MAAITMRPATPGDLSALVALDPVARHDAGRRDALAAWIAGACCHVAAREGTILGYAALTHDFFHAPTVELLMVAQGARRRGIGRALLAHCRGLAGPDGKLWTSTNESNAPMRALLAAAGFVESGIVHNLDPGDPELIYLSWSGAPRAR